MMRRSATKMWVAWLLIAVLFISSNLGTNLENQCKEASSDYTTEPLQVSIIVIIIDLLLIKISI